jgi:hypothetical protein
VLHFKETYQPHVTTAELLMLLFAYLPHFIPAFIQANCSALKYCFHQQNEVFNAGHSMPWKKNFNFNTCE